MYIYWFERILRKMSGFPSFALPYWNYSGFPKTRVLPAIFRDVNSPLYALRVKGVNNGMPLPISAVEYQTSLACNADFSTGGISGYGFGGGNSPPTQFDSGYGGVENQPHNVIHTAIGGLMGDPFTAAQDPIFWLHHANIDRLWVHWIGLGAGRRNPADKVWLTTSFPFFDENGNSQSMKGQDIMDTIAQLDYTYDDFPDINQEVCQGGVGRPVVVLPRSVVGSPQ